MSTSQDLLKEKLKSFDKNVYALAIQALEFSKTKTEKAVAELLESVVRKICSNRGRE